MNFNEMIKGLDKPKSIWVLYGGISTEREVSLRSGKGVAEALRGSGYPVDLFDVRPDNMESLPWNNKPDIVFIGLHGTWAEDGVLQGYLESRGVKFIGCGVLSSALCFHKGFTKTILRSKGLPTPASFEVSGLAGFEELRRSGAWSDKNFLKKWFIKPAQEGSTVGIERFEAVGGAPERTFLEKVQKALTFDEDLVIEEWVEGPELTVPILAGKAMEIVEIRPKSHFYDYSSKYTAGATDYFCPAPLDAKTTSRVKEIAEKAFVALKCVDYGRLDVMLGSQGPQILEMNTLPGMTETSLVPKSAKASGLTYETFCDYLARYSFTRQKSGG